MFRMNKSAVAVLHKYGLPSSFSILHQTPAVWGRLRLNAVSCCATEVSSTQSQYLSHTTQVCAAPAAHQELGVLTNVGS